MPRSKVRRIRPPYGANYAPSDLGRINPLAILWPDGIEGIVSLVDSLGAAARPSGHIRTQACEVNTFFWAPMRVRYGVASKAQLKHSIYGCGVA